MRAIVLAGDRPGGSVFARNLGVPASVLAMVAGRPSICRVIETLRATSCINGGVIAGPDASVRNDSEAMTAILQYGDFSWIEPDTGPAQSTLKALDGLDAYPVFVTTGDHPLLTPSTVERFASAAESSAAQAVVGLTPYDRVIERFPGTRRTRLRFRDASFCGTNLFLLRGREARGAVLYWQKVQQDRKRPWRIAGQLGIGTALRYLGGMLPVDDAFATLSRVAGCSISWVEIADELAAVDVDSAADLAIAEEVLGC